MIGGANGEPATLIWSERNFSSKIPVIVSSGAAMAAIAAERNVMMVSSRFIGITVLPVDGFDSVLFEIGVGERKMVVAEKTAVG